MHQNERRTENSDKILCSKWKKNRKETTCMDMLVKAYGDAAMKRTALHNRYWRYENGYESVMDEQCSGRPTSITSQKV